MDVIIMHVFIILYPKIRKISMTNFRKKILVGTTTVTMMIRRLLVAATLMVPGVQVKLQ